MPVETNRPVSPAVSRIMIWPTPSAPWRWMRSSAPTRDIRECRWAWPTSHCRPCLPELSALRPGASALARPRPFRAVRRARLDAAIRPALPDRLRGHDARRAEALPPAGREDRRRTHPEFGHAYTGIETTHRPAGPGVYTNAVGMALAERMLGGALRRCVSSITTTYVIAGDGCLMEEGISRRGNHAGRAFESSIN